MSYITKIFERLELQRIREFILSGGDLVEVSDKSYKERIEEPYRAAIEIIRAKIPNDEEYEQIISAVNEYAFANQDVYMEIGMQCGVILDSRLHTKIR